MRACDDRLCENCYQDNERKRTALVNVSNGLPSNNIGATAAETAVKSMDRLNVCATDIRDATCMHSGHNSCVYLIVNSRSVKTY